MGTFFKILLFCVLLFSTLKAGHYNRDPFEEEDEHLSFKEQMEEEIGLMFQWITSSGTQLSTEGTKYEMMEKTRQKDRLEFISYNYFEIQKDMARGGGEMLDTLARLYEVKDIKRWEDILQQSYTSLYKKKLSSKLFDKKLQKLTQYLNNK